MGRATDARAVRPAGDNVRSWPSLFHTMIFLFEALATEYGDGCFRGVEGMNARRRLVRDAVVHEDSDAAVSFPSTKRIEEVQRSKAIEL